MQRFDERFVRLLLAAGRGVTARDEAAFAFGETNEFGGESALADAGLAGNEQQAGPAVGRGLPSCVGSFH